MPDAQEQDNLIALLGAVAHQDRTAFKRLYDRVSGRMYSLCHKMAGQRDLAEEALQDAFVRIWHNAGEYHRDRGAPLSWMLSIARYRTLDLIRARQRHNSDAQDPTEHLEDGREGPLDTQLRLSGADALTGCLEELNHSQRDSILLSYYRGFTHDELAAILKTPIGTVKSWIRRGLLSLKRCLEQ
ncbi:sigma-70 family RNA polymerase sigma factor [Saccharospirillum salsuginis]|uniref:RNA polymerase sigma factor n=1 Tax=Saccharospirillum salsuginis TaxID=418750 RepID=A0A918NB95_9GAMM|nr:sigma-70 family RNA polymerase sigma factor [Saccharospirillum salsuginis]GGX57813.1 RNA polymerase sigma factor [Saccharospirillum salsuginis]